MAFPRDGRIAALGVDHNRVRLVKTGTGQDFQDAWTLDVGKLRKCCVSEIVPDGRLTPFCAYNAVGYREQVRAALASAAP